MLVDASRYHFHLDSTEVHLGLKKVDLRRNLSPWNYFWLLFFKKWFVTGDYYHRRRFMRSGSDGALRSCHLQGQPFLERQSCLFHHCSYAGSVLNCFVSRNRGVSVHGDALLAVNRRDRFWRFSFDSSFEARSCLGLMIQKETCSGRKKT